MSALQGTTLAIDGRVRSGLIVHVRALRRRAFGSSAPPPVDVPLVDQVNELRAQVRHLEQLVQGLQDAVYRDSRRHDDCIAELQHRVAPGALAAAISQDADDRGR